jgi:hypothetical protein
MDDTKTWDLIHAERSSIIDTLTDLAPSPGASFPVGAKKPIAGLRLAATDVDWTCGTGPEVSGDALSLLTAMTGRRTDQKGLTGDGVPTLASRI